MLSRFYSISVLFIMFRKAAECSNFPEVMETNPTAHSNLSKMANFLKLKVPLSRLFTLQDTQQTA